MNELLQLPNIDITIRPANQGDLPFIDSLQKMHTKQVGWMPTKTLEGKIKLAHVLVALDGSERVGYVIGNDQYFKRDDVGIIYQLNVMPGKQRGFIGASLLKAQFERSAYGCKLYCCWCAQDIAANMFWEAMGFVALAFRAGSEKKSRVHIFWQKRIRAGDETTPWWFPSKTAGGSIREDRLVLPIPPGTHWSDAKPMILPTAAESSKQLPAPKKAQRRDADATKKVIRRNGLKFDIPQPGQPLPKIKSHEHATQKAPRERRKFDPKFTSAARELRDRWLEELNSGRFLPGEYAKYEVARIIEAAKLNPPLGLPIAA